MAYNYDVNTASNFSYDSIDADDSYVENEETINSINSLIEKTQAMLSHIDQPLIVASVAAQFPKKRSLGVFPTVLLVNLFGAPPLWRGLGMQKRPAERRGKVQKELR